MPQTLRQAIESAVNSGRIGDNCTFLDLVSNDEPDDNFASVVVFADILAKDGSGDSQTITMPVAVKRQKDDEAHRQMMHMDGQFYNEVLMYEDIIPYLCRGEAGGAEMFPNYVFGRATFGHSYEDDVLVVEDLRQRGFVPAKEKIFLDFDHCALALKKVAQFHSLSYLKKRNNMKEFLEKINRLKTVGWVAADKESKDGNNKYMRISIERGLEPLAGDGMHEKELSRLRAELEDPMDRMAALCRPEEPLAVLCHGDFCRNNMLFRYDSAGRPVDVRLIDVATARYASPAVDLTFFLTMNTSAELRTDRWDELLRVYHEALTAGPHLDLDTVRREVSAKLVYGYVICSFFIPIMIVGKSGDVEEERWSDRTPEELEELSRARGGELATRHIADVARHVLAIRSSYC